MAKSQITLKTLDPQRLVMFSFVNFAAGFVALGLVLWLTENLGEQRVLAVGGLVAVGALINAAAYRRLTRERERWRIARDGVHHKRGRRRWEVIRWEEIQDAKFTTIKSLGLDSYALEFGDPHTHLWELSHTINRSRLDREFPAFAEQLVARVSALKDQRELHDQAKS